MSQPKSKRDPRTVLFPRSKWKGKDRPVIDRAKLRRVMREALGKKEYLAFLNYLDGYPEQEIGVLIGVGPGRVHGLIRRCRTVLTCENWREKYTL